MPFLNRRRDSQSHRGGVAARQAARIVFVTGRIVNPEVRRRSRACQTLAREALEVMGMSEPIRRRPEAKLGSPRSPAV